MGCHLAGACPFEALDISAVGRGRVPALPAPPVRPAAAPQVQDQLLRLRHRLRPGDVQRRRRRSPPPAPSTTARSSRASGCSSPAVSAPTRTRRWPSRSSPPAKTCWRPSRRSCGCSTNHGNRDNKLRARLKWVVDTMGIDELRRRVLKERQFLLGLVDAGPAASPRTSRSTATPRPASHAASPRPPIGQGTPVRSAAPSPTTAGTTPTSCAAWPRARCRPIAYARLGDVTTDQFRALASIQRELGARGARHQPPELRLPRPHRGAAAHALRTGSTAIGMAEPGAELARDVVACPGADTCNLAVTQSRGPRRRHRRRARGGRARRRRRRPHQHLGLHQLAAASTTSPTSASSAPSAGPTASRPPATRCCSAATSARRRSHFGEKALRLPGQERPRGRGAGRRAGSPTSARPARSSASGSTAPAAPRPSPTSCKRPRRVPHARGGARVLRRLRRDRSVRGRDRRVGVRDMMLGPSPRSTSQVAASSPTPSWPSSTTSSSDLPAAKIIQWAVDNFAPAPLPDRVDDRRRAHRPRREGLPGHRGRVHRHRLPLPRDARDGRDRSAGTTASTCGS